MAVEKFSILQIVDHNSYELCRRKELMKLEKKNSEIVESRQFCSNIIGSLIHKKLIVKLWHRSIQCRNVT